jgi:signal transduction histidine kinase/CheY-like chemotaxis protein
MNSNVLHDAKRVILLLEESYLLRTSNIGRSIEIAEQALSISKMMHDKSLIGKSLNQLSLFYMIVSDFEKSTTKSQEAISFFKELNDERGIADANYNIGSVYYKTNNYHLGLVYLIDALKIYKKFDDLYNQSKVEKAIGTIYEYIGDGSNAFRSYKNAIRIAKIIGDYNLESNVYNNLSGLALRNGKTAIALRLIQYSTTLKKQTNDVRGYAFAIYGLGKVLYKLGQYEEAETSFLESIRIHIEMGEKMGTAMAFNKLGALYLHQNLFEKAEKVILEGLKISLEYNLSMMKIKLYHLLYLIFKKSDDKIKALEYLEFYLKEKEAVINTQTLKVIENYDLISKMNTLEQEALLEKERQLIIDKNRKDEKESVKLKQQFLSIMSHEIRTPLNAITTIVSMLNEKVDEEGMKLLKSLHFASNNLIHIVNDVLDFTKLDANKAKLEVRPTNFRALLDNIFHIYEGLANEKRLQFDLNTNVSESVTYLIDETKITQIFGNLIGNAIKFTEQGNIAANIQLVNSTKTHDLMMINVRDTGEGISEEDLNQIFVSFSQIKPILTRKQGGTGLGLAIVKKLVELHKSKIKVNSKLGVGSDFYFELKLKKVPQQIVVKKERFNDLNGKIALLAEDTPMNALLMKKLLSNWGIVTDHVINGKLAVQQAKKKKYDFVLMDIHMPEMNGYEATRLIRNSSCINSNSPIFALTADVTAESDDKNNLLFNGFLWKPIEIEKLYDALVNRFDVPLIHNSFQI